jgi:hypothetical protein
MALYKLGKIHSVSVTVDDDDPEVRYVVARFEGEHGNLVGHACLYERYLDLSFDIRFSGASICRLKSKYENEASEWDKYEKNHAAELAEYKRLKAVFGDQ